MAAALAALPPAAGAQPADRPRHSGTVTLIQLGDLHARLTPMPAACGTAAAAPGRTVGGLARVATVVERIRAGAGGSALLLSTGDAVQGSAEALFTRGEAVAAALDRLRVDAHAPGNWDFVYGPERFVQIFAGAPGRPPLARVHAVAANLYGAGGRRVLPPYRVLRAGGLRVGVLGLTTARGLPAVGAAATRGFRFTDGEAEVGRLAAELRGRERVDVVVLASELGLAANARLAERHPGIDVVLSADTHETTRTPVVARGTGTLLVESGANGVVVGELALRVDRGRVSGWRWTLHAVTDTVPEEPAMAAVVDSVRAPFLAGPAFVAGRANPLLPGARLAGPLDEVVGWTAAPLYRGDASDAALPGVVEGTAHDFLADAIRAATAADVALLRGFRFGGCVLAGPVTRGDLYAMLPIGAGAARLAPVRAARLRDQVESAVAGVFDPDPRRWAGGWGFAYAGLGFDLDVYAPPGGRAANLRAGDRALAPGDSAALSVAGLWFAAEPNVVSGCARCAGGAGAAVVRGPRGEPLDAVELAERYLASLPGRTYAPGRPRVALRRPLPPPLYGWPVVQPLQGVSPRPDGARGGGVARAARSP
ncbi:MAG TPA: 5'-nucleotidase C-terminal domain-containing protein [Gemmatimonadaceae bacterium]|nr:5'-nucleotidase C-terminal domain-containing protein [Gemmatimonadaceae bacterium]